MTTGGTESLIMACKAYRDYAKETRGVVKPEIVMPVTAHSGFDKAAQYLGLRVKSIPLDHATAKVDIKAMEKAISRNTVMVCKNIVSCGFFLFMWKLTVCLHN